MINKDIQNIIDEFGKSEPDITIHMRQCDDVQKFIQRLIEDHEQTAESILRFGPPSESPE